MANISLFPFNEHRSAGRNMEARLRSCPPFEEFECVELEEFSLRKKEQQQREKVPRRIIHFSSGETMEEYSTDEEDDEEKEPERKDLLASSVDAVRSKMTWGPFFWFHMWRAATSTISACDYVGERMASLFGITSAKYQYAIDEYYKIKREREEEKEDDRLSEEAEGSFNQHSDEEEEEDEPIMKDPSDMATAAARMDAFYQVENEHQTTSCTIRVPAIVMAT